MSLEEANPAKVQMWCKHLTGTHPSFPHCILPTVVLAAHAIPVHPSVAKGAEMSSFPSAMPTQTWSLGGCLLAFTKTLKHCHLFLHACCPSLI